MFRIANGFGERNTMMEHNELYRWKITARNQCTEDTVKSYLLMTFTVWFAIHVFLLRPWRINLIDADNDLVHKLQNRKNIYLHSTESSLFALVWWKPLLLARLFPKAEDLNNKVQISICYRIDNACTWVMRWWLATSWCNYKIRHLLT